MCMWATVQASLPLARALRWPQEWAASPFLPRGGWSWARELLALPLSCADRTLACNCSVKCVLNSGGRGVNVLLGADSCAHGRPCQTSVSEELAIGKGRRRGAFLPELFPGLGCPSRGTLESRCGSWCKVTSLVSTGGTVEPPDWTTVRI